MKNITFLFFAMLFLFTACRKDELITEFEFDPTNNGAVVSTILSGQVIDENGLPLADAIVRFNSEEVASNDDGFFSFMKVDAYEDGQMLTIQKEGFFNNFKRIVPNATTTFQRIGLVTKDAPTGKFPSTEGATIEKIDGEKITFLPNSFVDESGTDYSGEVSVYTHHFNPESPYIGEMIPGNFSAISDQGNRGGLSSYSTLLVELFGEDNQKLNIKSGSSATVEFPIKGNSTLNPVPETTIWSLDELTGIWTEEGTATKVGDFYQATVSHFSFWSCAEFFDFIRIDGEVLIEAGRPLERSILQFESIDGLLSGYASINMKGKFFLYLPLDTEFIVSVIDYCGEVTHIENIGPFLEDQNISITINSSNLLTLSGTLFNCDQNPVVEGYAVAELNSGIKYILPIDENANFNSSILVCEPGEIKVYGVDIQGTKISNEVSFSYEDQTFENIGSVIVCEEPEAFISMSFLGRNYLMTEIKQVVISPELITVQADFNPHGSPYFSLRLEDPRLGTNTKNALSVGNVDEDISLGCTSANGSPFSPCTDYLNVEITKLDDFIGGLIKGEIDGQVWAEDGTLVEVQVKFKVVIDFKLIYVSGRVWDDIDKDGIQDPGEPGLPDVSLTSIVYYDGPSSGAFSFGAITNVNGNYSVLSTLGKAAKLRMFPIYNGSYDITLQSQGNDPALDSDFSPITREVDNVIALEGVFTRYDCGAYEQ